MLNSVALEVNFSTLRKKALAALAAAVLKNVTACFGCHACAESVLTFAGALGWLVSMFHCLKKLKFAERERKLVILTGLSIL